MPRKPNVTTPPTSEEHVSDPGELEDSGEEYVPPRDERSSSSERGRTRVRVLVPDTPKEVRGRQREKSVHRGHYFACSPSSSLSSMEYRTRDPAVKHLTFPSDTPAKEGPKDGENIDEERATDSDIVPLATLKDKAPAKKTLVKKVPKKTVVRAGTKSPASPRPKKEKKLKPCMLGCKKKYERLDKHYSSGKHGYTPEQALILSRRTDLSASTNTGRRRKRCPVPGCRSITSRLTTHLKNERIHHNLTSAEIERFRSMAGNWVPAKWMPFHRGREPPCLQDGVRRHPLFDRPLSGRCLLLHDLIVLSRLSRP